MNKNITLFIAVGLIIIGIFVTRIDVQKADAAPQTKITLEQNEIYYFYIPMCPYCKQANDYIKENLPNIRINMINANDPKNFDLFYQAADKHKIPDNDLSVPFISIGDNYLLGWGPTSGERLKKYIKELK